MNANDLLLSIAPNAGARKARQKVIIDTLSPYFFFVLNKYDINTPLRVAHFFGQTMVEAAGYATTREFASGDEYQNKMGNTQPGDGARYKGRGFIQLTGKNNYRDMTKILGLDILNHPELIEQPYYALVVSCEFWKKYGLNKWADADDVKKLGNTINRGNPQAKANPHGYQERVAFTDKAKRILSGVSLPELIAASQKPAGAVKAPEATTPAATPVKPTSDAPRANQGWFAAVGAVLLAGLYDWRVWAVGGTLIVVGGIVYWAWSKTK